MGILDDLDTMTAASRKPQCRVYRYLIALKPADRADWEQALANKAKYPHSTVAQVMQRKDPRMTAEAIGRHRRGLCSCER
jgi:hypothetical protein